jgi:putative membrane protein
MIRAFAFGVALIGSAAAYAAPASQFLSDAIKGDNSEVRLGQLIATRGHSPEVRRFGNTLVEDHSEARVQASAVARQMHASVPGTMMAEAQSEYHKLQRLHGHAFDREVRRYMINDHQKDIAEFRSQARDGDRKTAALASAQLPTLRKHLRIAKSLPQ